MAPPPMITMRAWRSKDSGITRLLVHRRIAIERRQLVCVLHPGDALRHLDMSSSRNGARIVVGPALDVDDPGQDNGVRVEQAGAACSAEMPAPVLRGGVNLRLALRHLNR